MKKIVMFLMLTMLFLVACESEPSLESKVTKLDQELSDFINSDFSFETFMKNCPFTLGEDLEENLKQQYILGNSPLMYLDKDSPSIVTLDKYEKMTKEEQDAFKEQAQLNLSAVYGIMNYLAPETSDIMEWKADGASYVVFVRRIIEVDKIEIENMPNISIDKPVKLVNTKAYFFDMVDSDYVWVDFDMQTSLQ